MNLGNIFNKKDNELTIKINVEKACGLRYEKESIGIIEDTSEVICEDAAYSEKVSVDINETIPCATEDQDKKKRNRKKFKTNVSYSMDTELVKQIKEESLTLGCPESRLVENIIRFRYVQKNFLNANDFKGVL
jgi:hypothetical protein